MRASSSWRRSRASAGWSSNPPVWPGLAKRPRAGWTAFAAIQKIRDGVPTLTPLAWSLTAAVFGLGLHRPRVESRRLMRRPGLSACAAGSVAFAAEFFLTRSMLGCYLGVSMGGPWLRSRRTKVFSLDAGHYVDLHVPGFAVLAAWLTRFPGGRWRPEAHWVDRAGRALGLWWIAMILVHLWLIFTMFGFIGEGGQLD